MYRLPKQDPTGGEEVKTAGAPVAVRNAVSDEGFSNSGRGGRGGRRWGSVLGPVLFGKAEEARLKPGWQEENPNHSEM